MAEPFTRASDAPYDALCQGRFLAQQAAPEQPPGEYAEYGKELHDALATGDISKLDHEQLETYERATSIIAKVAAQFFGLDAPKALERPQHEKELKVYVAGHTHIGHPDIIYRWQTKALIPDLKSLRGSIPDASVNEQIRDYACSYWMNTALIEEIATVIVQPMVTMNPEVCVYDIEALKRGYEYMANRIVNSHKGGPRTPGDLQCKFCRAAKAGLCPEYNQWASSQLPVPASLINVPVAQWQPEQRRIFVEKESIARKWLDDTWDAMVEGAQKDPGFVPGYKLKDGNEVEVLMNIQLIFERFCALGGTQDQFMKTLEGVKIKTKLAALVSETTGAKGKSLEKAMESLTDGASIMKKNKPTLVKEKK